MIGKTFEDCRVVEKIRESGMSTVYRAETKGGEPRAVKVLSVKAAADRLQRNSLRREAQILAKLRHAGIVRTYAYGDGPPRPFIVMEYFPGENLKHTLWHLPELLLHRRARILRKVAQALHYAGAQGIVHRDIKPENVLVNEQADTRLIDFSIAQTGWDRLFARRRETTDGTPLYMSPEQIRRQKLDGRSDQYSFGVMMYEIYTKRAPFMGTSQDSILEKHLTHRPQPPSKINPDAPEALDKLVLRMLSKRREDRFPDLAEPVFLLGKEAEKEEAAERAEYLSGLRQAREAGGAVG